MGRDSTSVFTDSEREDLVAGAEGLHERLDEGEPTPADPGVDRLDEWYEAVPGGRDEFETRRELAGVSVREARLLLAGTDRSNDRIPNWVTFASDIVKHLMLVDTERTPDRDEERPFFEVISHLSDYAWSQIDWDAYPLLSPSGAADAKSLLQDRLEELLSNPLYAWFDAFRRSERSDGPTDEGGDGADEPLYDQYISYLLRGGFKEVLLEYPVVAQSSVHVIANWTVAMQEFLQRAHDDRRALDALVSGVDENGVTGIESVGDPHEQGRETLLVETEDGGRVVYKPRSISPAAGYNDLLEWVNERADLPDFEVVSTLDNDEYGWMEWVEHEPCDSEEEVELFYRRAGALLALLYAFRFIDGNVENVVANGSQPVFIDLETIADPGVAVRPPSTEDESKIERSVLRTSILPREMGVPDMAGLSREAVEIFMEHEVEYEQVNTDEMELSFGSTAVVEGKSLPRLDGEAVPPKEYTASLCEGFTSAYEFLVRNRRDLLAESGPLRWFDDLECRCILRSTITYMRMIKALRRPEQLSDGFAFDAKLERLTKPFVENRLDEEFLPVFHAETRALRNQNVPRFTVRTSERSIFHSGEPVARDVMSRTPLQQIRRQIESLSRRDLSEQLDYIRSAYDPNSFNAFEDADATVDSASEAAATPAESAYHRQTLETAEDVLAARAGQGESASWILRRKYRGEGLEVMTAPPEFYEGRLGIAFALAGVAEAVDSDFYAEVAREVALDAVEARPDDPDDYRVLGGARGLGGDLYALTRIGSLTGSEECIDLAVALVEALSPSRVRDAEYRDVFRGSAGLVLGAGTVYERTGSDVALRRAIDVGEQLTAAVVESEDGPRWKAALSDDVHSGFIHGTTGIAYALAYLGEIADEPRFRELSIEAASTVPVRREAVRVPESDDDDATRLIEGWANGITGVGLGLLGIYEITGNDVVRQRVEESLAAVDRARLFPSFELQRGRTGRVEWFTEATGLTDSYDFTHEIHRTLGSITKHTRGNSAGVSYRVPWHTDHWTNPSLFNGLGGVAYTFARRVEPSLPNVLLWE